MATPTEDFLLGDELMHDHSDYLGLTYPNVTSDSYDQTHRNSETKLYTGSKIYYGQSFNDSSGGTLTSCIFYLRKQLSPTGTMTAELYAHSGTYGSTGVPTGAALAVSDTYDVSNLTTSFAAITFTFSGANQVKLTLNTKYFIVAHYEGGNATNYILLGDDQSATPVHSGNPAYSTGGAYTYTALIDIVFFVYCKVRTVDINKINSTSSQVDFTNANFANFYTTAINDSSAKLSINPDGRKLYDSTGLVVQLDYTTSKRISMGGAGTPIDDSFFFGQDAGLSASSALHSVFFCQNAGKSATTSTFSNFLGYDAGSSATHADHSNFFGQAAGLSASSASYSFFAGYYAGASASAAWNSFFVGYYSGYQGTNAHHSIFLGDRSGYQATNSAYSIFLGYYAGNTATNATECIFIGSYSGNADTVDTTGSGTSICIGKYSGTGGYKNSVAIGHGVKNSAATEMNLGNILKLSNIYNSDTPSSTLLTGQTATIGTNSFVCGAITASGNVGLGVSPTAYLHIKAGTATASTAPLKFTSGTLLTNAEAGAIEFLTDDFFATITTGPARKAFILDDGTRLTAGRVPFATTNGRLTDDGDMTFATDTLTVTKIAAHSVTGDLTFVGAGTGLSYGGCNGLEIAWVQAAVSGTWYDISDNSISATPLNNVTHSNGQLTLANAGIYLISYGITAENAGASNTHVAVAVSIDGTENDVAQSHIESQTNSEFQMANSGLFTITAGQTVNLSIRYTGAGTPNITVDDYSLNVVQVGG